MYTLGISLTTVSEYVFLEKIYFKTLILQTRVCGCNWQDLILYCICNGYIIVRELSPYCMENKQRLRKFGLWERFQRSFECAYW